MQESLHCLLIKIFQKNKIEAGECATPGIIALKGICFNQELKNKIKLNKNSKVLVFGCEGATDEKMYNKLLKTWKQHRVDSLFVLSSKKK